MSSPFVILHLSDAHLGKPGTKIDVQHVMAPLWEDLKKMRDLVGSPSLIVFTGDLTFGAAPGADTITSQYGQASIFLD